MLILPKISVQEILITKYTSYKNLLRKIPLWCIGVLQTFMLSFAFTAISTPWRSFSSAFYLLSRFSVAFSSSCRHFSVSLPISVPGKHWSFSYPPGISGLVRGGLLWQGGRAGIHYLTHLLCRQGERGFVPVFFLPLFPHSVMCGASTSDPLHVTSCYTHSCHQRHLVTFSGQYFFFYRK